MYWVMQMAREFARKFYDSKAWKDVRALVFNEANGICEKCGEPGEEVHHLIWLTPYNINDYDIALGRDNLILLCKTCHINIHRPKEITRKDLMFDEEGNLIQVSPL